ncbi:MAG: peptidylprolyl isomerase [Porticoccaceae bacterium]|nr:peptidylprolyl isomerase [Porticoccaceae bacterium]MDG1474728.1 peptidylprolyl isomerase [Porticoccaceae bacterium]
MGLKTNGAFGVYTNLFGMKVAELLPLILAIGIALASISALAQKQSSSNPVVELKTEKGTILIELYPDKAPVSVDNFVKHVNDYHYDGLIFHRVIKDFMIQSGGFTFDMTPRNSNRATIINESNNGLKNERGTIAMARMSDPNSAQAQFFINHKNNTFLDAKGDKLGYAVFGKVISGMTTVDMIAQVKTTRLYTFADVPVEPIRILTTRLVNPDVWTAIEDRKTKDSAFERPIPLK